LINPVDSLARVINQFHHFGLRHALLGAARHERDAGAMERKMWQIQGVVLLEKPPPHFDGFSHLLPVPTKSKAVWPFLRSALSRVKSGDKSSRIGTVKARSAPPLGFSSVMVLASRSTPFKGMSRLMDFSRLF
jgi:hypothetical protein